MSLCPIDLLITLQPKTGKHPHFFLVKTWPILSSKYVLFFICASNFEKNTFRQTVYFKKEAGRA